MNDIIKNQIEQINASLAWIKSNKPDQYEQRFLQLVAERCRLRKIALTATENPAIAAYGESQKGKSYVITNLLSDNGDPFSIAAPERRYDFVKEINPITNNVEATGVVTRFTTFAREPERYDAEYPVMVKLLSIAEVATILCDGYHSDLTDYQSYSDSELENLARDIYDRYSAAPEQATPAVTEDDILDLKYYLVKCTGGNTQSLVRSPLFDRVALVARHIPADDWADVLSVLWHRNATLTRLFVRLCDALRRLGHSKEVYLPVSAVLNSNQTLMSVQRINELGVADKTDEAFFTDVVIRHADGRRSVITRFDKSELSALCSEAVFKIDERFLNSQMSYDLTMITDPTVRQKLADTRFRKDLLRNTDLLDFPGARARNQLKEENLDKTDEKSSMTNDANVYLRGKVAYLFNRYSDAGLINILLFCHDNAQRTDDTLYITIENWVKQYVGETPQQRSRTLTLCGGVSPFFIIATKFNIDMTMAEANANDVANTRTAIDQRWTDRFNIVLFKEVIHGNDADWFKNWTAPGDTFKNTYLLRDYKYSGDTGKGNNLYLGFRQSGRETSSAMDPVYYERLRRSFIESPHVAKFFGDPALSWDVAATINNDGSLHLFERLATAVSNLDQARKELNYTELRKIGKALYDILKNYYHSDDAAKQLLDDMNRACAIRRELTFACNHDNYFFGRLIRNLQTSEKRVYNTVYDIIHSSELNDNVNTAGDYELIRSVVGARLDRCSPDNDNAQKWECLVNAFNFTDRDEAERYLASRGVDPYILFSGMTPRKNNSSIIAERVFNSWIESIKSAEAINRLSDNGNFDPIEMSALVENIEVTAGKLNLAERLEKIIADQVNVNNVAQVNVSFIADLMASEINDFVCDLGYRYRTADDEAAAKKIIDDNPSRFDPITFIHEERKEQYSADDLTAMFNRLNANPEAVTPAFDRNYRRWIEFMIISFLLKGEVIDYNIAANKKMGEILERLKTE